MNSRTVGIIATAASVLLCGCPGLFLCVWGVGIIAGMPITTELNGVSSTQTLSPLTGVIVAIIALVLIIIPVVIAFLTLRKKPGPPQVVTSTASAPAASVQAAQPAYQPPAVSAAQPPVQAAPPSPQQPAPVPQADSASQQVVDRLMALNRPTAPYRVIDGRAENVDLIAEWKIVDAQWYEIFGKASLTKVFRIYLKLDPAKREVRAMDREYSLQWSAGVPSLSAEASFFKGQKSEVSFGMGYAFTEEVSPGVVYKYRFNTNELKKPIQEAVAACGWKYKGVAFGKL